MAKILTVPVLELRSGLQRDTSGFSWRGVPGSRPDSCGDPGLPSTQEAGIPGKRVQGSEHPLCLPPENPHAEPHLGKVPITQRDDRDTRGLSLTPLSHIWKQSRQGGNDFSVRSWFFLAFLWVLIDTRPVGLSFELGFPLLPHRGEG